MVGALVGAVVAGIVGHFRRDEERRLSPCHQTTNYHNAKGWTIGGVVGMALGFLIATAGSLLVLYVLGLWWFYPTPWSFFPLLLLTTGVGFAWVGIRLANWGDPRGPIR